jgi:hypothetical protein
VLLALAVHFAAGLVSVVAGTVALSVTKGGLVAAYLVFSAMTTVKSLPGIDQRFNVALMVLAFIFAAAMLYAATTEWLDPAVKVLGCPRVVPPLVMGMVMVMLLAASATCARSAQAAYRDRDDLRGICGGCASGSSSRRVRSSLGK